MKVVRTKLGIQALYYWSLYREAEHVQTIVTKQNGNAWKEREQWKREQCDGIRWRSKCNYKENRGSQCAGLGWTRVRSGGQARSPLAVAGVLVQWLEAHCR